jgi:hypothetical protein
MTVTHAHTFRRRRRTYGVEDTYHTHLVPTHTNQSCRMYQQWALWQQQHTYMYIIEIECHCRCFLVSLFFMTKLEHVFQTTCVVTGVVVLLFLCTSSRTVFFGVGKFTLNDTQRDVRSNNHVDCNCNHTTHPICGTPLRWYVCVRISFLVPSLSPH